MKKRVVLVNPPNEKTILRDMYSSTISKGLYNWPCTDLLVISGVLKDEFDVTFLDANTLRMSLGETLERIAVIDPLAVVCAIGNSVKNDDYDFIRRLRERIQSITICGTGGILFHNAENEMRALPEIDACLLNFTSNDIVKFLKGEFSGMNNIVYRHNGEIVHAAVETNPNGFSYPVPLHEQLPLHRYRLSHGKAKPLTSVLTSYGCPATCRFCVAGKISYSYRSPDNIIEELDSIHRIGVKEVFFRDNAFCSSRNQGNELLDRMIERQYGFSWIADVRAVTLDSETVWKMKRSGCHALHIGVESGSPEILRKYNKGATLDHIRSAFALCKENGIKTVGYFIIGLPGEKTEDVMKTIDLSIELDCDYASFNIALPIVGTTLWEESVKMGWIDNNTDTIYDGSLNAQINSGDISNEEISALRDEAYKRFYLRPSYFLKKITGIRNIYQFKMLVLEFINMIRNKLSV